MNIITQAAVLKQLTKMLDRSAPTAPVIDFVMDKPLCPYREKEIMPLPRVKPEDVGVRSQYIFDFLRELTSRKELDFHGIMIMKNGKIICDAEFGPYRSDFWHQEYSLSKSVTAAAIGMLIDDGLISLDDKAVKLLEGKIPAISQLTHKNITVRHLLTMTAGVGFTEAGTVVEKSWIKAFFETLPKGEPGTIFSYNSLNTYVLSYIVKSVTGKGLTEFLKPRLFDPIGITVYNWEKSPEGIECGGWGLYLRREDVAKLAKLYLDLGVWNGKRIISEDWINDTVKTQIKTPISCGDYNYGYHVWTGRSGKSFLFNGMFGQDMIAFPETDTAVIVNGGIEQLFQQSYYYRTVEKYFGKKYYGDKPIKSNIIEQKNFTVFLDSLKGIKKRNVFSRKPSFPDEIKRYCGINYIYRPVGISDYIKTDCITGTGNIGILPFVEQTFRNKFTEGINRICLSEREGRLYLDITEGITVYSLPLLLTGYSETKLKISATDYHTAVTAAFTHDEDGRPVLKLRISFPEISSARLMKVFFEDDHIDVEMDEIPGIGLVNYAVSGIDDSLKNKKIAGDIVSKLEPDMLYYKLKNTVKPSFRLYSEK